MKTVQKDLEKAFKKANMKLQKCQTNPLTPDQKRKIDAADKAIREYFKKVDTAFKLSRKSTLHFGKGKASHTR